MAAAHEDPLDAGTIELADTRPDMLRLPLGISKWLGEVPIEIGVALITMFMVGLINFSWRGAIWFPFIWWAIAKLIAYDYHAMTKIKLWQRHTMRTIDAYRWGGASVSPLPTTSKMPRGMVSE